MADTTSASTSSAPTRATATATRSSSSPRARDAPGDTRSNSRRGGRVAANTTNRRRPAAATPAPADRATLTPNGSSSSGGIGVGSGDVSLASSNGKVPRGRGKNAGAKGGASSRTDVAAAGAASVTGVVAATPTAPPTPVEALVHAIRSDDIDAFRAVLAEHVDLDINTSFTPDGDTALVEACRYARHEMAALLLHEKRANVNIASSNKKANRHGLTPLIAACMALDAPLVELLLRATNPSPELLLMYGRVNAVVICALFSVANGHTDAQAVQATALLEMLLTHAQATGALADVLAFETEKGNRLVHIVAGVSNWRALAVLRAFGADMGFVNRFGKSPLSTVEANAFERRSLAYCTPPKQNANGKKGRRQGKHKRGAGDTATAETDAVTDEPESQADLQSKITTKKIDKAAEKTEVTRTYVELAKSIGFACMFSRKGDSTVGFVMRCLVLAHVGFVNLANEFALAADDERAVMIDGLVYTLVAMYSASLKHSREYVSLWQRALASVSPTTAPVANGPTAATATDAATAAASTEPVALTPGAFKLIIDDILANRSLSRRVQTMAMVLLRLEAPYASNAPLLGDVTPNQALLRDLNFYRAIAERLYRSGVKLLFCVFDRTDVEENESYDEEIEFHLLIALTELLLQFFVPFAQSIVDRSVMPPTQLSATAAFQQASASVKKLWPLVIAGMSSVDDPIASPQRFSLLLHVLQVFAQVEASLVADEAATVATLFRVLQGFVRTEASKKRIDHNIVNKVHLLQTIARALPLPTAFLDNIAPLKDKLDILIRSDAKIVGVDLYALATVPDFIRLEHKVDYLGALAEEQHGSVSVTISRASASNHVDFILQQILSTSARNMKGELNITLINEPGVGVGVIREFFQIVQKCFFSPSFTGGNGGAPQDAVAPHVAGIGSQWLQLARTETATRHSGQQQATPRNGHACAQVTTAGSTLGNDFTKLFPLFEYVDKDKSDELRITARKLRVTRSVMDAKQRANQLSLSSSDVAVDKSEVEVLKKLYQCVGRLLGLAIRNHQPLNVHFPLVLWQFLANESVSWREYCGANEVFRRSLQFVLDHDFDASPLEMHFEVSTPVVVVDDSEVAAAGEVNATEPSTATMELQLKTVSPSGGAPLVVTNANKLEYVELRAKQHFFGHEGEYYRRLRDGLLETIHRSDLKLFRAVELQRLARGERHIDFASMKRAVLYSSGASVDYGVIKMFWDVVEQFDQEQREQLLTFWSGSPQPPLFGFETTARSMSSDAAIWYIDVDTRMKSSHCPMANTCDRRLILPDYPSAAVLKTKLSVALSFGAVGYDRM